MGRSSQVSDTVAAGQARSLQQLFTRMSNKDDQLKPTQFVNFRTYCCYDLLSP